MALPKSMRLLAIVTLGVFLWLVVLIFRTPGELKPPVGKTEQPDRDPNLDRANTPFYLTTGEPPEPLRRVEGNNYAPDNPNSARINATLLSLVRNEELGGILQSMRDLERTWNHKFNYPWTFFNDVPFTEEFKRLTQAETKAQVNYEL
ncbi:putative mannosyltransferase ktr4, partial [Cryomyces antarcticus]